MTQQCRSNKQFCIIGAGGIGSFYAMKLLLAQQPCTMVARGKRLTELLEHGLQVSHNKRKQTTFYPPACDLSDLIDEHSPTQFLALLICTKSSSTSDLAQHIARWFLKWNATCPVISLQNGIDNESILAATLPQDCVFGGLAVKIGAHLDDDGLVAATGPGELILGSWPSGPPSKIPKEVITALEQSDIPFKLSHNIHKELWLKLMINNGVNPLSALTGLDTRTLSREEPFAAIVYGLMQEAAAAATADDLSISTQDVNAMYDLICSFDAIKTSMLVDHERGRPLELSAICGAVLTRHQRLRTDAPYTRTVYALLQQGLTHKQL
jgi:2-dehydropantoate 2-reductase